MEELVEVTSVCCDRFLPLLRMFFRRGCVAGVPEDV